MPLDQRRLSDASIAHEHQLPLGLDLGLVLHRLRGRAEDTAASLTTAEHGHVGKVKKPELLFVLTRATLVQDFVYSRSCWQLCRVPVLREVRS